MATNALSDIVYTQPGMRGGPALPAYPQQTIPEGWTSTDYSHAGWSPEFLQSLGWTGDPYSVTRYDPSGEGDHALGINPQLQSLFQSRGYRPVQQGYTRALVGPDGQFVDGSTIQMGGDQRFWNAALAASALAGGAAAGAGSSGGAAAGGAATSGTGAGGAAAGGAGAAGAAGSAGGAAGGAAAGGAMTAAGIPWWQLAATLGSTAVQSYTADRAADRAAGVSQAQYDQTRADFAPWRAAGQDALGQLMQGVGQQPTADEVMNTPGYQFGLQQGQQAIDRQIARGGGRVSGQAIKAAARFGTDYATSGYNAAYQRGQDRLNRLASIAGLGQTATGASAAAGAQNANAISGLVAGNNLAQGSLWGSAINQLGAMYGRQQQGGDQGGIWGPTYDDTEQRWGGWTGGR